MSFTPKRKWLNDMQEWCNMDMYSIARKHRIEIVG